MESPDQQQKETRFCDSCREIFFSRGARDKCLECSITTIHDDGMIQFPDRHFHDSEDIDVCEDGEDMTAEQIDSILDLDSLNVDEILTQDDPPKDLYLNEDDQTQEIPDDVDEDTAWMVYYGDEIDKWNEYCDEATQNFSIYDHFGIPHDLSYSEREALLEAAIPDRG
jgi:alpha-L-fucosidase